MIRLTDANGLTHYLAPQSIASIAEAGTKTPSGRCSAPWFKPA